MHPYILALLTQAQTPTDSTALGTSIVRAVEGFTDFLLSYAIALAAVGALAMALLEAWKKLLDTRTKFHAKRFTAWIEKSIREAVLEHPTGVRAVDAIADIIVLCTGVSRDEANASAQRLMSRRGRLPLLHAWDPDPAHAVFALEVERMMGAIQDAGDAALNAPGKFPALYAFMTTGGTKADVNGWFTRAETGLTAIAAMEEPGPKERQEVKDLTDTVARLRQTMKRKLDGFQFFTASRWANYNQFGAITVGFVLMLAILMASPESAATPGVLEVVVLSIFGGILSPIAKDIVTSLKRVKSGG